MCDISVYCDLNFNRLPPTPYPSPLIIRVSYICSNLLSNHGADESSTFVFCAESTMDSGSGSECRTMAP